MANFIQPYEMYIKFTDSNLTKLCLYMFQIPTVWNITFYNENKNREVKHRKYKISEINKEREDRKEWEKKEKKT